MAEDKAAAAREALRQKRESARQNAAEEGRDPRLARTPLERETARVDMAVNDRDLREAQRIRVEQTGRRPVMSDTTGTHPVPAGKPEGRQFKILHGSVGGHVRGATVHESKFPEDCDFDRLIDLEAIQEVRKGERGDDEPLDLLDFEDLPPETLTEAAFSENKPTLPRTDGLDAEPGEALEAMDQGVGTSGPREGEVSPPSKAQGD